MRSAIFLLVGLTAWTAPAVADSKQDWSDCVEGDPARVIAGCTRLIQGHIKGKDLAVAYNNRALAYKQKGDHVRASADLDQAVRLDTTDATMQNNRGVAYKDEHDYDRAIAAYSRAIALSPKYADAFSNRGDAYRMKGDYDRSISDLDKAIRLKPELAISYTSRGLAYAKKGDREHASNDFRAALSHLTGHPTDQWARETAEKGLAKLEHSKQAEARTSQPHDFEEEAKQSALELNKLTADCAGTDPDASIEACTNLLTISLNAETYWQRGTAHFAKGEIDLAIADYNKAVEQDSGYGFALIDLALAHLQKGEVDLAMADIDKACAQQKRCSPTTLSIRSAIYAEKGEFDRALQDLDEAIRLTPYVADIYVGRGSIYRRRGMKLQSGTDYDRALNDLDHAIRIAPNLRRPYLERGMAYEGKGDRERAQADFRTAEGLKSAPGEASIWSGSDWRYHPEAFLTKIQLASSERDLKIISLNSTEVKSAAAKSPAATQVPVDQGKRIALVIGNSAYRNVNALRNPEPDSKLVAQELRKLGFAEVIEKRDLSLNELSAELKAFGDKALDADWAVVYYAGHGIEVGGINYLIPIDAEMKTATHVEDEAIPLERVLSKVEGAKKLRLVILDACRDNPFAQRLASAGGGTRSVGRGLSKVEPSGGIMVAYSARDGHLAQDGDGFNSPFAEALVQGLDEPGVEISLLFRKVRDTVWNKTHGQQEPFTYGSLPAEALYFKAAGN
jgi:tetratricopeptide (TPR) repeat protein